jgi:hypothetical protein
MRIALASSTCDAVRPSQVKLDRDVCVRVASPWRGTTRYHTLPQETTLPEIANKRSATTTMSLQISMTLGKTDIWERYELMQKKGVEELVATVWS